MADRDRDDRTDGDYRGYPEAERATVHCYLVIPTAMAAKAPRVIRPAG